MDQKDGSGAAVSDIARTDDDLAITSQLMIVQEQLEALPALAPHADAIAEELESLFAKGVNAEQLQTIHDSALVLLETADQQDSALRGVMEIARRLQGQRDQTRETLDDLRDAISDIDLSNPDVAVLCEAIETNALEYYYSNRYEDLTDHIADMTPLTASEANKLLDLVTGELTEFLEEDDPMWDELRRWIERGEAIVDGTEG